MKCILIYCKLASPSFLARKMGYKNFNPSIHFKCFLLEFFPSFHVSDILHWWQTFNDFSPSPFKVTWRDCPPTAGCSTSACCTSSGMAAPALENWSGFGSLISSRTNLYILLKFLVPSLKCLCLPQSERHKWLLGFSTQDFLYCWCDCRGHVLILYFINWFSVN